MSKKVRRVRSVAIYRVIERFRPLSGDSIGTYLQVAVPNLAAHTMSGKAIPSYEKPYKLEKDSLIVTDKDKARVLHYLSQKYILKDMTK